jgi:membrane dipeptidase
MIKKINYLKLTILAFVLSVVLLSCQNGQENNTDNKSDKDLQKLAQKLTHKYLITDGHIDLPYRLHDHMEDVSVRTERGDFDYVRAKEGGLDVPFMSIYIPARLQKTGGSKELADTLIDMVEKIASDNPEKFVVVTDPQQARNAFNNGKIGLAMGMENGSPVEGNLDNIKYFHDRGIRYITLTHSKDNHICDSSYDTTQTWSGLSPFGYEVVKEMNKTGIMIDVSHISDKSFYQVMEISAVPVIASHSSCRHFTPGFERNMNDDMIKLLAMKGGVIQINFGSTFIDSVSRVKGDKIWAKAKQWAIENNLEESDPKVWEFMKEYGKDHPLHSTVSVVADHIDYVVNLVGINHVGLGSDFDGLGDTLPIGLQDASEYPNLIFELLKRDYNEEDIAKICSGNVFRVWQQTEDYANAYHPGS